MSSVVSFIESHPRRVRIGVVLVIFLVALGVILQLRAGNGQRNALSELLIPNCDYCATAQHPALSPSGRYLLVVIETERDDAMGYTFQIREQEYDATSESSLGDVVFVSDVFVRQREVAYVLWDSEDRIWLYSADIGTLFWSFDPLKPGWEQSVYDDASITAPDFLKNTVPSRHAR